jgi:hypothetical protein
MYVQGMNPHVVLDVVDDNGRPIGNWYSLVRYEEGTFDGGAGFQSKSMSRGIRLDPTTLPSRIRFRCKPRVRPLPDVLEPAPQFLATRKFRDIVEALEPGRHQIHPVIMTWKDGSPTEDRWIVIPTQRLDTADRERTTFVMKSNPAQGWSWWDDPSREDKSVPPGRFVIDPEKVVEKHLWQDKYLMHQVHFVSDRFRSACESAGVKGIGFKSLAETDWLALGEKPLS